MYTSTGRHFYSYFQNKLWEHSDFANPGNFYGTLYPFEIDFIDKANAGVATVFSSISYMLDVTVNESHTNQDLKFTNTGFTSFYVYNSQQISGSPTELKYLSNIRLADNVWHINEFRDMSLMETSLDPNLITGVPTVQDTFTTGVIVPNEQEKMFLSEGTVNLLI